MGLQPRVALNVAAEGLQKKNATPWAERHLEGMNVLRALFAPVLMLSLTACKPPSAEEVSARAGRNTSALVGEAWDTVATSTNDSRPLTAIVNALNLTLVELGGTALPLPNLPMRSASQGTFDEYERLLRERVFAAANVESSTLFGVTFLVDGQRACTDETGASSAECVRLLNDLQLRVVVSGDPDARLVFEVLFGVQRISPLTLAMEKDHLLEATFRLNQYKRLLDTMTSTISGPLPGAQQLELLDGEYQVKVEKLAPHEFAFSYSVTRDAQVRFRGADGQLRSATMAARVPSYRARFDAVHGTQTLDVNVGPMTWQVPGSDVGGGAGDTTVFAGTFDGLQLELSTDTAPALARGRLTIFPAHVTWGSAEVASLAVAAPFTWSLDTAPDGRLQAKTSELDATASLHFAVLPSYQGDPRLGDERWHVTLRGASPALKLSRASEHLAVRLTGAAFRLEALNTQQHFEVAAGQCLAASTSGGAAGPLGWFSSTLMPVRPREERTWSAGPGIIATIPGAACLRVEPRRKHP